MSNYSPRNVDDVHIKDEEFASADNNVEFAKEYDDDTDVECYNNALSGGECTNRPDSVKCSMCGQTVADDNDMNNHILEHEKSFWFFCALCDANFVEGSLLRLHVAKYHCDMTATSLKCWMCGMHFKLRGALSIHLKHCRRAPACVVCKGVLKNGRELEEHYQCHSLEERESTEFLSCHDCGEVFITSTQFREHQKCHGNVTPFPCEECEETFHSQRGLDKHRDVHIHQQQCKCSICGVQLVSRSGYAAHLRGHLNKQTAINLTTGWQMATPDECSGEKEDVVFDEASHHKEGKEQTQSSELTVKASSMASKKNGKWKSYHCQLCDLRLSTVDSFQNHMRRLHRDEVEFDECDICHILIYGKDYLAKHRRNHFASQYPCDQCSKVFQKQWALDLHRKVHSSFKMHVQCDICGDRFRFVSEVDKHKRRAHRYDRMQSTYQCNLCKSLFATLSHLSVHVSHVHYSEEGEAFRCAECSSCFRHCLELKQHIYRHHETSHGISKREPEDQEEPNADRNLAVSADVRQPCGDVSPGDAVAGQTRKVSRTEVAPNGPEQSSLQMFNMEVYNTLARQAPSSAILPKRFACETCSKRFTTKSDLRTHIRTHTGETPYKCEFCPRAFKQRGHRKLHVQVAHTKDMPFTCEHCGLAFPTRYRYRVHIKRHIGIKEHRCCYCDREYYTAGKLNEHKRRRHPIQMLE